MQGKMSYIVLDFETVDPWINEGRGSGWVEKKAKFLCAGTYDEKGGQKYWDDVQALRDYLDSFHTIVAHNAPYDMGILHSYGHDIFKHTWVCTRILAILLNNNLLSFSLDSLANTYLGMSKNADTTIGQTAIELGLVRESHKTPGKVAVSKHMDAIFEQAPDKVREYVLQDIACTETLYRFFSNALQPTEETIDFYSDLMKALLASRQKGILVHIPTVESLYNELLKDLEPIQKELKAYEVNPASPKQLGEYFTSQGLHLPLTEKGMPSTGIEGLSTLNHPLARLILDFRAIQKLLTTYLEPIREIIRLTETTEEYIKVYPEVMIFGAHRTGRCSCKNPNIQNIPTRKKMGNRVRGIFHPPPGMKFASFDYNGQELRLIVHISSLYKMPGTESVVEEYNKNPLFDMHQVGADILGIQRKKAKEIVLGIPYGLWHKTMAVKLEITEQAADQYMKQIVNRFPFLHSIAQKATKLMKARGYVKDISGRKIYMDSGFARKALNGAVQGSAAYQTNKAIVDCYRQGIIIGFPIHDELVVPFSRESELDKIKEVMEKAVTLAVPSVVNMKTGINWGELS